MTVLEHQIHRLMTIARLEAREELFETQILETRKHLNYLTQVKEETTAALKREKNSIRGMAEEEYKTLTEDLLDGTQFEECLPKIASRRQ